MNSIQKRIARIFLPFICALSVNLLIDITFGQYRTEVNIHTTTFTLIILFSILAQKLDSILNKVLIYFWFYFYLCGLLFLNTAFVSDPKFSHLSNEDADNFYFVSLIALTIGILVSERTYQKRNTIVNIKKDDRVHGVILGALLLYPIAFLVVVYSTLGFIPMLLGDSIVDDMYNYNYGFIYGFKFYIIISILVTIFYFFKTRKKIFMVLAVLYSLISLIDGKRAILLVAILSSLVLYYIYTSKYKKVRITLIVTTLILTVLMYVGLSFARVGKESDLTTVESIIQKFPVGVEYTDYVYSFDRFSPGSIHGYSFLNSSFGALMNSSLLEFLGLDKEELVQSGSAYTWMKEYNSDLGIRTGIVSELYFDYGYWTIFLVFLLGFYFDYIGRKIFQTNSLMTFFILLSLYGLNVLSIVGQATVYFGSLTLMIYIYGLNKIFSYRPKSNKKLYLNHNL